MDPLFAVTYFFLSSLYCITLIFMVGTLNSLNQVGGLKDEKASIMKQFGFFLLSFVSRTIYYLTVFAIHDKHLIQIDLRDLHYYIVVTEALLVVCWDVLPIGYVVYTHKNFYK